MTPDQLPQLLAQIALADPRVRREDPIERRAQVRMWAGILADVPYDEALRLAQQHYASSQWPVLPADIAARWRAIVRDRLTRHTDPTPAADPDNPRDYNEQLRATRQAVALGQADPAPQAIAAGPPRSVLELTTGIGHGPRPQAAPVPDDVRTALADALPEYHRFLRPELAIACPWEPCRARPGTACVRGSKRHRMRDTHPARRDAYAAQQSAGAA